MYMCMHVRDVRMGVCMREKEEIVCMKNVCACMW